MKIFRLFMLFPLLFNGFLQMMGLSQQDSDKLATVLYSEFMKTESIAASYRIEESEHHLIWKLQVEQQTKEEQKQKVKLQIHDEQNQTIPELANVEIPGLVHQEDRLAEAEFTRQKVKEFSIPLPKKYRSLQVTLQLDEMRPVEKELRVADAAVTPESEEAAESEETTELADEDAETEAEKELGSGEEEGTEVETEAESEANAENPEAAQSTTDPLATETIMTEEAFTDILSEKEQGPYHLICKLPDETQIAKEGETETAPEDKSFLETVKENVAEILDIQPMAQSREPRPPLFYPAMYPNKQPEYSGEMTQDSGVYPTHSWTPIGQENVLNHQGGVQGETDWDKVTEWDLLDPVAQYNNSYIHYGVDYLEGTGDIQPSVSLRKYASETAVQDLFDIRLNVRGESVYQPGVDIVLLLDNTGSLAHQVGSGSNAKMGQYYTAEAAKTFITELKKLSDGDNIRLGGYTYSDNSKKYMDHQNNRWPESWVRQEMTADSSKWMKIHDQYSSILAEGQTFTQRALMKAKEIFDAAPPLENRKKMLFILTDGGPNVSYDPVRTSLTFNDHIFEHRPERDHPYNGIHVDQWNLIPDVSNPSIDGAGTMTTKFAKKLPVTVEGEKDHIFSHITLANSTAYDLKQAGIEIHTVGVDIKPAQDNSPDYVAAELKDGLAWMSTVKANHSPTKDNFNFDDFFYIDVTDFTKLKDQMKEWIHRVQNTVEDGILTDPMSDYVDYIDDTLKVSVIDKNGQPVADPNVTPTAKYNPNTRTINVEHITLTDGQTLQVDYQVRLKGEGPGRPQGGKWYPTNKQTTLNPMPERNTDLIDFGVPSVRIVYPESEIPVEKIWIDDNEGTDDFWGLRPDSLKVWLQTPDNNGQWTDVKSLDLTAIGNWQGVFEDVEYTDTQRFRVVERVGTEEQLPGYDKPLYQPEEFTVSSLPGSGVKITNRLLTTDFKFTKVSADGQTPFPDDNLPEFALFDVNDRLIKDGITPLADGTVLIDGLPMGEYYLKETIVPPGYTPMPDLVIKVTIESDGSAKAVAVGFENNPDPTIINRLEDYDMTLHKEDLAGNELRGAVFKLTNKQDYEETISNGPQFDFTGLKPGTYYLTEESPPEFHLGLAGEVVVTVNHDGSVSIDPHELVEIVNVGSPQDQKIVLKIKNITLGVLPQTGGKGNKMILYSGFAFASCLVIGMLYLVINKRRGPT